MLYGYKASAEQFGTKELLDYAVAADRLGYDLVAVSDHFQPWRHHGGHAPLVFSWLGAAAVQTKRAMLSTSVLTPIMRYHPSIVAQGFATLAQLAPGRILMGVGTGEAMNETPATGDPFPGGHERRARLHEAIDLIRALWSDERVTHEGRYYQTQMATIYERPDAHIPIYLAAGGPLAGKLAGRIADGMIATSGKPDEVYTNVLAGEREGAKAAGRDHDPALQLEVKVSYGRDLQAARSACDWWAPLGLPADVKQNVHDPIEMERLADAEPEMAQKRFIVSDDPDEVVERVRRYVDLGFTELVFHGPGPDQPRFLAEFATDVLPKLREAFGD
jgi:coenzyme F420-dependent glucose-6-phosphate dehydrogenase